MNEPEAEAKQAQRRVSDPRLDQFLADWRVEIATRRVYFDAEHRAYDQWVAMRERMDYWLTSMAGAVLAYAVQSFDGGIIVRAPWLAPLSWACLLTSVVFGLRSLRLTARSNVAWLRRTMAERAIRKRSAGLERHALWKEFGIPHLAEHTDEEAAEFAALDEQIGEMMAEHRQQAIDRHTESSDDLERLQAGVAWNSRIRTALLVSGLALLAMARLINLTR